MSDRPLFYPNAELSLASAQVLLRWATQRGIAVVPKSNSKERLSENLQCNSFDLDEADIKSISALNIDLRVSLAVDCWETCHDVVTQLNNPAEIDPRLAIFA